MDDERIPDLLTPIQDYVVRIEIPNSYGTGFLVAREEISNGKVVAVIASAYHVIEHAAQCNTPIIVTHHSSGKKIKLAGTGRGITAHKDHDLAVLRLPFELLPFPEKNLTLNRSNRKYLPGTNMYWCGLPNNARNHLCLFRGCISSQCNESEGYLVDGVAIHGVSGGPAFIVKEEMLVIIGIVAAYIPNMATGEPLPGMSLVRSINPMVRYFENMPRPVKDET